MMFSRMWTSVAPLTLIRARQKSFLGPGSTSVLAVVWMPSKRPMTGDQGGLVTPEGGVAKAGTTTSALIAATTTSVIGVLRWMSFICPPLGGVVRCRGITDCATDEQRERSAGHARAGDATDRGRARPDQSDDADERDAADRGGGPAEAAR